MQHSHAIFKICTYNRHKDIKILISDCVDAVSLVNLLRPFTPGLGTEMSWDKYQRLDTIYSWMERWELIKYSAEFNVSVIFFLFLYFHFLYWCDSSPEVRNLLYNNTIHQVFFWIWVKIIACWGYGVPGGNPTRPCLTAGRWANPMSYAAPNPHLYAASVICYSTLHDSVRLIHHALFFYY